MKAFKLRFSQIIATPAQSPLQALGHLSTLAPKTHALSKFTVEDHQGHQLYITGYISISIIWIKSLPKALRTKNGYTNGIIKVPLNKR